MSRELTKMNLIAIVQQLPEEDIHTIETYIRMIEQENKLLQEKFSIVSEMNVENYNKYCEALKEQVVLKDTIKTQKLVIGDLADRINKAIKYLRLSNPAHWSSKNELELLEILGDNNE